MLLSNLNIRLTCFTFIILAQFTAKSQTKGVIIDKDSRKPIPYACIYAKNGKHVLGAMSDELGRFNVNFGSDSIFFSHINYFKLGVSMRKMKDTIFLAPNSIILNEVIVGSKQPKWIVNVLKEVVKQKHKNYMSAVEQLSYLYETTTLSDSSGYAFHSKGDLLVPVMNKDADFNICVTENTIRYKDKTAGPDFNNLKSELYNGFIENMDNSFIKNYSFSENYWPENKNKNLVQLMFTSTKFKDDRGYIVVDTLNKVVLEYDRKSGIDYNVSSKTSFLMRAAAAAQAGIKYDAWQTEIHATYSKIGNCLQMTTCKYKLYIKISGKYKKKEFKNFHSSESKLSLSKLEKTTKLNTWHKIPKPYYIIFTVTKKMREEEEAFKKGPTKFESF